MAYNPESTPVIYPPTDGDSAKPTYQLPPLVLAIGLPLALASGPVILSCLRPEFVRSTMARMLTAPIYHEDVSQVCLVIGQSSIISGLSCGLVVKAADTSSCLNQFRFDQLLETMSATKIAAFIMAAEAYILARNVIFH